MRQQFFIINGLIIGLLLVAGYFVPPLLWVFIVIVPLALVALYDILQKRHTILRNFPLIGHFRYIFESIRPEINQYFVESDVDGRPFNRIKRSIIYQRSKGALDTDPFGTKLNHTDIGYEWMLHSIKPANIHHDDLRITFGGPQCTQPYSASILNISAMSYGSLSKNAILAMNGGARDSNFAHNTGEGGISPYHGGDLIWQIGTGYFGCRDQNGDFDPGLFRKNASRPSVKMIELKLSQGAKPGHGGILPGKKNTPEIAEIRGVEPYQDVLSPPGHTAFSTPVDMMHFIQRLRELSDGKPIGFKFCLGHKHQFLGICQAIVKTGIYPDFIAVDGAEGGTGAAPLEFSNWIGTPLVQSLTWVQNTLIGFGLREHIRIIASGKVVTGFDIIRLLCLGADSCNSARAMMMATGCIQALRCNTNQCPTGVATQDPVLTKGLDVGDKRERVARYHQQTIKSVQELVAAAGVNSTDEFDRNFISRRIDADDVRTLEDIYPYPQPESLLAPPYPEEYQHLMQKASADSFV